MTASPFVLTPDAAVATDLREDRPFGRGLTLTGFAIIAVFLGALYGWSRLAPIESAVVAPGVVSVDTSVRTVQHLEGGLVEEILVREGDLVSAGEVLLRLRNTGPASALNEVLAQYFQAQATAARLTAERDGLEEIDFPRSLREKVGDAAAMSAIAGQRSVFETSRALRGDRRAILERSKDALSEEITGLESQIAASRRQLEIVTQELATAQDLYERQLTERPRVLAIEREQAQLEGAIGQLEAAIGTARQRLAEAELRMTEFEAARASEIVDELRVAEARVYELGQRIDAAQDVLRRTLIRSPIDGVVVDLNVHTVGGVVSGGETLLNVVPVNDKLVVQATIDPLDIDRVGVGQEATVWLSAVNRRTQSGLPARVQTISADRLVDPRSGAPYYLARVELDTAAVERSAIPLQAGMGAEVMIRTGARTTWEYVSAPIARSFSRTFREN